MTLDDLKTYLRVDGNDDDAQVTAILAAATGYINRQTGKTKVRIGIDDAGLPTYGAISDDELYNLCIKVLCAHWYENRGVEVVGNVTKLSHSVDALVNHISMCGDYI